MTQGNPTVHFSVCASKEEEARLILSWRNDPETLRASYHQDAKSWPAFWDSYARTIVKAEIPSVFASIDGKPAAFLRFRPHQHPDGLSGMCVDLSVVLAPEMRGQGFGAVILSEILPYLRDRGVDSVIADVRRDNVASYKVFKAAGYGEPVATEHRVDDTGEVVAIYRYTVELTSPRWRRGGVYVIAEAGSNWRMGTPARDMAMAKALIDAAVQAKADCVKFQTYRPETVYVSNAGKSDYLADAGVKEDISAIFSDLAMPYEMIETLAQYCRSKQIDFMSTGFSRQDFLQIDPYVAIHKVASYESSHPRLLELCAKSQKPLVLSTGAATEEDIAWSVQYYQEQGGTDLCLMQCTAKYPAPLSSLNLAAIPYLRQRFGVPVGLSDHSRDPVIGPVGAVALGARCIEKHYTLSNALPGPDHSFAITADELSLMVSRIRDMEAALGQKGKTVQKDEQELRSFARRGIQAITEIRPGDVLREDINVAILRPGKQTQGLHPKWMDTLEGKTATRAIQPGEGVQTGDWAE